MGPDSAARSGFCAGLDQSWAESALSRVFGLPLDSDLFRQPILLSQGGGDPEIPCGPERATGHGRHRVADAHPGQQPDPSSVAHRPGHFQLDDCRGLQT